MFNSIGFGELAIICIVLIIAVGPERLPSMMKTVGKTVRTLRQASRDLRESTGIDELLREDFDYTPPPRRAPEAQTVSRDIELVTDGSKAGLPSDGPLTSEISPLAANGIGDVAPAPGATPEAGAAPPHGNPQAEMPEFVPVNHADIAGTLPSDAPLAANEPTNESEVARVVPPRES